MRKFLTIFPMLWFMFGFAQNNSNELIRIKYNNPELQSVDLGVGLWAWPFSVDYDNDGDLDLLVNCPDKPFNGLWLFENTTGGKNPVLKSPVKLAESQRNLQIFPWKGRYIATTPGVAYPDFLASYYQNQDTLFKEDFYKSILKKPRFNLWRYVDYENDGDLDIVIAIDDWTDYGWDNAFNEKGVWTNGPLHGTVYLIEQTKSGVFENPKQIIAGGKPIDNFSISGSFFEDFDGDGDLDIVLGEFLDRLTWVENTGKKDADGPVFRNPVYLQQEPQYLKFGALVTPFSVDWDDDGDEDLICGNTAGYIGFIENLGGGENPCWAKPVYLEADGETILIQAGENGSIQGPAEKKWGYTTLTVADWNGDGLMDIIMLDHEGYLCFWERFTENGKLKLKPGQRIFTAEENSDFTNQFENDDKGLLRLNTREAGGSGRRKFCITDWDRDGLPDLIVNSVNVTFLRNKGTKNGLTILEDLGPLSKTVLAGHSTSPTIVDWDKNGIPDLLIGAEDGHFYYLKNSSKQ